MYLNLSFTEGYDVSLPRVIPLWRDNEMATREATYVDDIRVAGRGLEGTRMACKQLKSQMNSLANQANDGKYWPPLLMSGAWKGEIIPTDTPFPMKSTTGKKWVKFRVGLR